MAPSLSNTLAGHSVHDPERNLHLLIYRFNIPSVIIHCITSTDNGTTWSAPKQVWGRADVKSTILSVDSLGNLYLSMFEGPLPYSITAYFTKSTQ